MGGGWSGALPEFRNLRWIEITEDEFKLHRPIRLTKTGKRTYLDISCAAEYSSFKPGEVWLDTDGKPIQAHACGVMFYDGVYYLYGQNMDGPTKTDRCKRVDVIGVSCYSSKDLYNWKNEGIVLKAVEDDPNHDLHPSKVLERPKVVYNAKTKKFVMWMHIDSKYYKAAKAGVAVADSPTGPFKYIESVNPEGQDSRDQTLFVDDDGKAYHIFSSEGNKTTYISLMSDDYLKHTGKYVKVFKDRFMEAAAICKRNGKYYFFASGCTSWAPNAARSAVADSIWGPWKELGNPCAGADKEKTFFSQSTFILPVADKEDAYIFVADRWNMFDLSDSRYVWLPIDFHDGKPEINWLKEWDLSFFQGTLKH